MNKHMLVILMIGTTLSVTVAMQAMDIGEKEYLLTSQQSEVKKTLQDRLNSLETRKKNILSYPRDKDKVSDKQYADVGRLLYAAQALHADAIKTNEGHIAHEASSIATQIKNHFRFFNK